MFTHKNVEITVKEVNSFKEVNVNSNYNISNNGKFFYVANSKHGTTFALNAPEALNLHKNLIDSKSYQSK
jgi:hypothetical protein